MKTCSSCNISKDLSFYSKRPLNNDGLQGQCKECISGRSRARSQKSRDRINKVVRGKTKAGSSVLDLGCSISEFREYLESLFQPGMNWNNYGSKGWHIDHMKPLALFDLSNRQDFLDACHYTNLQPLWAEKNLKKGAKYE